MTLALLIVLATSPNEIVAQAQAHLAPAKAALKEALTQAVAKSPVHAIDVCSIHAPEIAKAHSKGGVLLGRSALKLRNQKNKAPTWAEKAMHELSAMKNSDANTHRSISISDTRAGYVEAIWVQPMCLTCHGENISQPVADAISSKYPNDEAINFKAGDFRGIFWVEFDKK